MKKNGNNKTVSFIKGSSNDSFEIVEIQNSDRKSISSTFEVVSRQISNSDDSDTVEKQTFTPITAESLSKYIDDDGRVVQEAMLREALFHGGCRPEVRRKVWTFIFELYPMMSTGRERKDIDVQNHYNYHALKTRCFDHLKSNCGFNNSDLNQTSIASEDPAVDPSKCETYRNMAEIYAGKQSVDLSSISDWYRVIDKDIPRTDIDHPYFHEKGEDCLVVMKNILVTFGFFHPSIGYVQGMNDILTRFMVVLQSEVDAYWCFSNYMERTETNFDENGMVEKIEHVRALLKELEPNLFSHFCACSVPDLLFVHRWLLVSFKREFDYEDSIRYFEMAQSQHLNFDSHAALSTQDAQYRVEVMKNEGKQLSSPDFSDVKYTLEVFVCVSVIMLKRQEFLACTDESEVFNVACHIRGTLNLEEVHDKAYGLFFKYCRKYVRDQYAKEEKGNILQSFAKTLQSLSLKWPSSPSHKD